MISTRLKILSATALTAGLATALAAGLASAAPTDKPSALQSAGPLAFAPNGVLLIGDTAAATVVAVETGDIKKGGPGKVEVADLTGKIAAMLGAKKDEVAVNDVAVNPMPPPGEGLGNQHPKLNRMDFHRKHPIANTTNRKPLFRLKDF